MKNIIKKWLGLDRFEECKECGVLCHRNKMKKIKAYILDEKTKVIESYYKYKEIKKYIEKSKSARERKNKNKFIAWLIFNKFHLKTETMTEELLEDIIVKASDYDRHWRKVLEENPTAWLMFNKFH